MDVKKWKNIKKYIIQSFFFKNEQKLMSGFAF